MWKNAETVHNQISEKIISSREDFENSVPGPVCHKNSLMSHRISIMIFTMTRVLIMALFRHFIEKFIVKVWIFMNKMIFSVYLFWTLWPFPLHLFWTLWLFLWICSYKSDKKLEHHEKNKQKKYLSYSCLRWSSHNVTSYLVFNFFVLIGFRRPIS